ncbi:MAG: hypothetical protein GF331_20190 [Chitinivibrionales bacterium]|nr:hypothetical protein [Chitinivibrionales bacterium]
MRATIVRQAWLACCMVCTTLAATEYVYTFTNDVVHVEAENLEHNGKWSFENSKPGYKGSGYLRYVGPEMNCQYFLSNGEPILNDTDGTCQGAYEDRLHIAVWVETPGLYSLNIHNYHELAPDHFAQRTTDFSVWVHVEGFPLPVGISHADNAYRWDWLAWGPDYPGNEQPQSASAAQALLEPGLYEFYVAGRNRSFCVDRISIYRKTGRNEFPADALNLSAPLSQPVLLSEVQGTSVRGNAACRGHRAQSRVPVMSFDMHGRRISNNRRPASGVVIRVAGERRVGSVSPVGLHSPFRKR